MTKETNKTRPTHRVYAVTKNGESKFWQPVGAMWAHADASGFNLRIDYLPSSASQATSRPRTAETLDERFGFCRKGRVGGRDPLDMRPEAHWASAPVSACLSPMARTTISASLSGR